MTAGRRTRDAVLLLGGGVGITPMRALFETIPLHPPGGQWVHAWSSALEQRGHQRREVLGGGHCAAPGASASYIQGWTDSLDPVVPPETRGRPVWMPLCATPSGAKGQASMSCG